MMHALTLVCLCFLTWSGAASADGPGPEVIKVEQDGDVLLPCSRGNKQNMESGVFHWKKEKKEVFFYENGKHYNKDLDGQDEEFIGRVLYFQDQLKHGNASIIIRNTKMEDAGTYTCAFPRLQKPETYYIELVVGAVLKDRSGENIPVAQKPYVTILDETNDWVLLQCEAHGNPRPEVKWEDSSGNQVAADEPELSERGSSFYVKLNVTVKKTDHYRCVATQETISHQIYNEIFVWMNKCSSTGWIGIVVAVFLTLSLVGVLLAVFVYERCIALNYEKGSRRKYETPQGNEEHQLKTEHST